MNHHRLLSGFIIILIVTVSLLLTIAGPAQAATPIAEQNLPAESKIMPPGALMPPGTRLERPLLQNTPVLTLTKIAPAQIRAGETLTYTLIIANGTVTDATNSTITDTLDLNKVTFITASDHFTQNQDTLTWDPITVTGNATITRTLRVTVNADLAAGTLLTNTAGITSSDGAGSFDAVSTLITTEADLAISKTAAPATAIAGETLTSTLTVQNFGPSNAQNVLVTDTLPLSVSLLSATNPYTENDRTLSWQFDEISSGETREITLTVGVDSDATQTLTNTASITSTTFDSNSNNNDDTLLTTVETRADLAVNKVAWPEPAIAGETLTYTLTLTNNGPSTARNVIVTDTLPLSTSVVTTTPTANAQNGQDVGWNLGDLTVGATRTLTVVVDVDGLKRGTLNNTAAVTSTTADPEMENNSETISTNIDAQVNLVMVKDDSVDPVPNTSTDIEYTIIVANTGPSDAINTILTDTLPTGLIYRYANHPGCPALSYTNPVVCNLGIIKSGDNVEVRLQIDPTQMGIFTNYVEVTSNETGSQIITATEETTVSPADLQLTKSGPTSVRVGYPLAYSLNVENNGPNDTVSVILTDTLPNDVVYNSNASSSFCNNDNGTVTCSLGNITNGSNRVVSIVVTPTIAGTIINHAEVSSTNPDLITANNTASATTTIEPVTDLSISKTAAPDPVIAGETLDYSVTITNHGPSNATGLIVTDTLPSGVTFDSSSDCTDQGNNTITCELSSLPDGDSYTFDYTVTVEPDTRDTITNTARVGGNEFDPDGGNNSINVDTVVNAETNLSINKSANPPTATPGEALSYNITVTNTGPSDATRGITVTDTLPNGVTFTSGSDCTDQGNGSVRCTLTSLPRNSDHVFTLNTTIAASITQTLHNTATVTSLENPTGASDNLETPVEPETDLEVEKYADKTSALPGDDIAYTVIVYNNGPSNATGVVLTDTLPAGVTHQTSTPGSCAYSGSDHWVTCNFGDLDNGDSISATILVTVDDAASGNITGAASVSGNETDPYPDNNTASIVSQIGEFEKVFLPLIMKPEPTGLYIDNDTGASIQEFTVIGAGVSCSVPSGAQQHRCGTTTFPPGSYDVRIRSVCTNYQAVVSNDVNFGAGTEVKRVFCR